MKVKCVTKCGQKISHETIDVIYCYVIWTDNGSTLPEASTWRQEGKYPMIKVLHGCVLKLSLHSVNSVLILYRTGNIQSVILVSFIAMRATIYPLTDALFYISPYVVI